MIRVNLLPVKRKKKHRPIPTFAISVIIITVFTFIVLAYVFFYLNSRLSSLRGQHRNNQQKIAELKERVREVENFEKLNKAFENKKNIIEQLRKNQSIPVKLLDEVSKLLPNGVWLNSMSVAAENINIDGYAFTNSDVVAYVDNLKGSKILTDVYLQESRQANIEKISLYQFKLTFKVKT